MKDKKSTEKNNVKKRNWAFCVYPESAPEDWIDRLQQTGLQCVVSPLHDKDVEPTGELKKAHYHVIAVYQGPTSFNVVNALTKSLNQPIPQALEQVRGYYRYLTHKDNPDKYQYDDKDIMTINGFNITDYVELSKSEIDRIKKDLLILVKENGITEYAYLLEHLIEVGMDLELGVASSNTMLFTAYIKSRRHIIKGEQERLRQKAMMKE